MEVIESACALKVWISCSLSCLKMTSTRPLRSDLKMAIGVVAALPPARRR
jgi:hypothetical protein